jgi:hypothetical protein
VAAPGDLRNPARPQNGASDAAMPRLIVSVPKINPGNDPQFTNFSHI